MERIKEIVKAFEQPGSFLSSAMLKKSRHKEVSKVCKPQYFAGTQFLERDTQMEMLDGLLYRPKNAKQKRNLIVAVASSGMGKSAFVDEYCRRTSETGLINCIAISFNTVEFWKIDIRGWCNKFGSRFGCSTFNVVLPVKSINILSGTHSRCIKNKL